MSMLFAPARGGGLWIGTRRGLSHWSGDRIETYPTGEGANGSGVAAILTDRNGRVWVATTGFHSGRLCRMEPAGLHCYGPAEGFPDRAVFSLLEDRLGNLWFGGVGGLYRWNAAKAESFPLHEPTAMIRSITRGNDDEVIAAASDGDPLKQVVGSNLEKYGIQPGPGRFQVRVLLSDRDGALWIGMGGQGLLHAYKGHVDRYTRTDGLSGDVVINLFEDREGNIWVATDRGLDRFRALPVVTLSKREGLSQDTARSVFASKDGSVWIGTDHGLNRVREGSVTVYDTGNGLPSNVIYALTEDHGGTLWAGTRYGLAYFRNGRFHSLDSSAELKTRSIAAGAEEPDGTLWFSDLEHGLIQLRDLKITAVLPWSLFGNRQIYALEPDSKNQGLWIGFLQGGIAYCNKGKVTRRYEASDGLAPGMISDLHLDADGTLWIASEGGLNRLSGNQLTTLTIGNGSACNRVHSMVEDDDGALWLNTACGLVRITRPDLSSWVANPRGKVKCKIFGSGDGMQVRTALAGYSRRSAKSMDGRLWFPVFDTVAVVDPRHLPENRLPPPVHIDRITVDREPYPIHPGLTLPPIARDLQIDYTAFSFVDPERVQFRYKLEGYDSDWNEASGRRQALYTNLPPRHYRFRVIAANNDGVWNETGASLEFWIQPAYYQTSWFKASCVGAFGALLWTLYRLRVRHLAAQLNLRFEERLAERTRISRELHDTLLQNISGFALQLDGLSKTVTAQPVGVREGSAS